MAVLLMRLVMLMLALLCSLADTAGASTGPVHLTVGQLQLEPLAELLALVPALQLSAPQLRRAPAPALHLSVAPASSASGSPNNGAQSPSGPPLPSPAAVRAARLANRMYIGDTWSFGGGRELSLHLTPNEGHCAPLMRLTF